MRIIDLASRQGQPLNSFGSTDFAALAYAPKGRVTVCRLAAGGVIGRHTAPVDQLFIVVAGSVTVAGPSDTLDVAAGEAVFFEAGESHETTSTQDAIAVIVESPELAGQF